MDEDHNRCFWQGVLNLRKTIKWALVFMVVSIVAFLATDIVSGQQVVKREAYGMMANHFPTGKPIAKQS